jgi:hypothetical protein
MLKKLTLSLAAVAVLGISTPSHAGWFDKMVASAVGLQTSEYYPIISNEDDYKSFIEKLQKVNDTELSDDIGKHYFKFYNNNSEYGSADIFKKYENFATIAANESGILEPVYIIDANYGLVYDKKATAKLHGMLSKQFKLLPLSETEKYHKFMMAHFNSQIDEYMKLAASGDVMGIVRLSSSGEARIHNNKLDANIYSKLSKHSYVIQTSGEILNLSKNIIQDTRYTKLLLEGMEAQKKMKDIPEARKRGIEGETITMMKDRLNGLNTILQTSKIALSKNYNLVFAPSEMYKNMKSSGFDMGALFIQYNSVEKNKEAYRFQAKQGSFTSAIADKISSNMSTLPEIQKQNELVRKEYASFLTKEYPTLRDSYINGLSKFIPDFKSKVNLATGIKSQKLD